MGWAEEMWDDAMKVATRLHMQKEAIEVISPLIMAIKNNPVDAAIKMMQLESENKQLKEKLNDTRN